MKYNKVNAMQCSKLVYNQAIIQPISDAAVQYIYTEYYAQHNIAFQHRSDGIKCRIVYNRTEEVLKNGIYMQPFAFCNNNNQRSVMLCLLYTQSNLRQIKMLIGIYASI